MRSPPRSSPSYRPLKPQPRSGLFYLRHTQSQAAVMLKRANNKSKTGPRAPNPLMSTSKDSQPALITSHSSVNHMIMKIRLSLSLLVYPKIAKLLLIRSRVAILHHPSLKFMKNSETEKLRSRFPLLCLQSLSLRMPSLIEPTTTPTTIVATTTVAPNRPGNSSNNSLHVINNTLRVGTKASAKFALFLATALAGAHSSSNLHATTQTQWPRLHLPTHHGSLAPIWSQLQRPTMRLTGSLTAAPHIISLHTSTTGPCISLIKVVKTSPSQMVLV